MSQKKTSFLKNASHADEEMHWLSVSDLMAGLMMVFLFISMGFLFIRFQVEHISA